MVGKSGGGGGGGGGGGIACWEMALLYDVLAWFIEFFPLPFLYAVDDFLYIYTHMQWSSYLIKLRERLMAGGGSFCSLLYPFLWLVNV